MARAKIADVLGTQKVRRSLLLSVIDGVLHAVMLGVSESYFTALAVELGHTDTELALLTSLPMFLGALSQLGVGYLCQIFRGRKPFVAAGATLQAMSHLGFLGIAFFQMKGFWVLFLCQTIFWVSGSAIAPAWGAWMASLTETIRRERYFAWRSAFIYAALLCAFALAGLGLRHAQMRGITFNAFAGLYICAFFARWLSAVALSRQDDIEHHEPKPYEVVRSLLQAFLQARWQTALYVSAVMFGTYVSVPFFTPYMLHVLRLDYFTFMWLLAAAIMGKAISFPIWHRIANRTGLRAVLLVSGIGVAAVPALWVYFSSVYDIFLVQLMGGAAWSGVEFASFQLLLRSSPDDCRVEFLSLSNALTGLSQVLGALFGSFLLVYVRVGYHGVFIASTIVRAVPLLIFVATLPRAAFAGQLPKLFFRLLSVRPNEGAMRRPIIETVKKPSGPSS